MLVLSRKHGESIVIDGVIKVYVIEVKGTMVRIGIDAPKDVPVHRSELYDRLQANNETFAAPKEKSKPDSKNDLHNAVIDHRPVRIAELIAAGADVNRQDRSGSTPLHLAAQEQEVEIAGMLIEAGALVDTKDKAGNTPLWRAVFDYRGDGELIVLLRAKSADASIQNNKGVSPVGLARRSSNYDIAKLFKDLAN